jgi:anthranilate phosphoribosyltransferase
MWRKPERSWDCDEISPCGETEVVKVWDGRVSTERLRPSDFGVEPIDPSALTCGDNLKQTSEILLEAITDADSPRCSAILPSAGAAIWLAGLEDSLAAATNRARAFVKNGAARDKLNQLIGSGGSA